MPALDADARPQWDNNSMSARVVEWWRAGPPVSRVDSGDTALVSWAYSGSGNPTIDPKADYDLDGDVDNDDLLALSQALTGSGTPPASLRVSGLGNPYFFTGRRLHLLEDVGVEGGNPNRQLQYNRARHYHPGAGEVAAARSHRVRRWDESLCVRRMCPGAFRGPIRSAVDR